MSLILKSLPLAAIGLVLMANKDALQKNLNIVEKVRVATTATIEIRSIAETVYMEWIDSDTLPLENFSGFLRENMEEAKGGDKRDRGSDMWGTPYRMARVRTGFEIRCAGPDKSGTLWMTFPSSATCTACRMWEGPPKGRFPRPRARTWRVRAPARAEPPPLRSRRPNHCPTPPNRRSWSFSRNERPKGPLPPNMTWASDT